MITWTLGLATPWLAGYAEMGFRGAPKMWVRAIVAIVLLLLPTTAFSQTEKRIALLIGNQGYGSEIGRLANPHNDVAMLEQALQGIRFDVVTARDVDLGTLTRVVNSYARRLHAAGPNAVGFFFYSRHGASDGITAI